MSARFVTIPVPFSFKEFAMSFLNWLPSRQARRQSFRSRCGTSAKPRHRARLHLEGLENRLAPAVFNVNSLADSLHPGPGLVTLRSALVAANNTPGGNTINLTLPGTYAITLLSLNPSAQNPSNDFDIQATGGNLIIANTSGGFVAVDGGFHSRVFDINVDNVPTPFTVTFRNFTIQNGDAAPADGANGSGGGIRSIGMASVVLDHMVLTNNFATADGGGISMENLVNAPWTLTIENGTLIANNHAGDAGGGVETDGQGKVFINTGTTIDNNTCVNQGAGIWLDNIGPVSANLTLDTVQVTGNIAFTIDGGIGNAGNGTVTINNCTVENNFSGSTGGGFGDENMLSNLTVTNSNFLMNYARTNGGGIQAGGDGTTTTISNSVIVNNVALGNQNDGTGGGGGIFFSGGTATVTNTLIA